MADEGWEFTGGFNIDDDQLDGLSPQKCFVLGYELAQLSAMFGLGVVPERPVHHENRDRIMKAARACMLQIELVVYHDDWLWLKRSS